MRKYLIIIIALVSLLSSCAGYRDITIGTVDVAKVKLNSASKVSLDLSVCVSNPTKANFTLTNVQGMLYRDDIPFANLALSEQISVPANYSGDVLIKTNITLLDPMAVLVMGLNLKSWHMDEFKIKLKATVKKGAFKKSIKLNNIPLDKLVKKISL
ncbi:MAG: hypothetical protein RR555_04000 [Bacteroidales bacterium]